MRHRLIALLTAIALVLPASAMAKQAPSELADLVERLLPAVVNVINVSYVPADEKVPDGPLKKKLSYGSGFVIDPKGLIATNRHVTEHGSEYFITFSNGRRLRADLVAQAVGIDLALLKARTTQPLPTVKIGTSVGLRRGDAVIAIGNPLGYSSSVSTGIISALNRDLGMGRFDHFLQTDAEINQGNSGGPLFNAAGEVVGINSAILTVAGSTGSVGIGFAIPIDDARMLGAQIEKYGRPRPAWLGAVLQPLTADLADSLVLPGPWGAIVTAIEPNSPALAAKLQVGDVILGLDGVDLSDQRAVYRAIIAHDIGATVHVNVWRDGARASVAAVLGEYPDAHTLDPFVNAPPGRPVPKPTADLGMSLAVDPKGVVVAAVAPGGVADDEHIAPGEVIAMVQGDAVKTPAEVQQHLDALRARDVATTRVLTTGPGGSRWVALRLK